MAADADDDRSAGNDGQTGTRPSEQHPAGPDPVRDGPPRAVLVIALVLAVGVVVAVLAIAAQRQRSGADRPAPVGPVPAPRADSADCRTLIDALPDQLGEFHRAPLAEPAPAGVAAWRSNPDDEPVVLRCGLDRPPDFVVGSPLQVVDDVQWFRIADVDADRSSWFAVDRPVYIALTLPAGSGPTPIELISKAISATLPAKPIDPAPVG